MHPLLLVCALLDVGAKIVPAPTQPAPAQQPTTTTTTTSTGSETAVDAAPVAAPAAPPETTTTATVTVPTRRFRRYGLHLGLNATLTFDASIGSLFYAGASTQLTGFGWLADTQSNYVVSLLAFGGVALPVIDRGEFRFTVDVTPSLGYMHSAPVNFLTVGLLAGVRLVHRSGFTTAIKLPLVGFTGSPEALRGSLYYYYIASILTVPVLTLGYTF